MPIQISRQIKVTSKLMSRTNATNGYQEVPSLNLAGLWLLKAGFQVGDVVEIILEKDAILIRRKQMSF